MTCLYSSFSLYIKKDAKHQFQYQERLMNSDSKSAFHLTELTGQTIPVVMKISLLNKTIQPDHSNSK